MKHTIREPLTCGKCSGDFLIDNPTAVHENNHSFDHSNFFQFDGNISLSQTSESSWFTQGSDSFSESSSIPVIVSNRESPTILPRRPPCSNKRVRRDNKLLEALNLPVFTVYNMRSVWSKLNNLAEDIIERSADISFLSEVWEKKENLKHQSSIEEMLEMKGIAYISTPRPGLKRGGGSAIAACPLKFSLVKLHIEIPKSLEVVWGLLRPKKVIGRIRKIILCSFYCPPRSKKKNVLIDHIATVLNKLKVDHPDAATIIAGDKNDLDEERILAIDPSLIQTVRRATRKDKILSVIITDLHRFYIEPKIVDPIPVDNPGKGVPSDHNGVLAIPVNNEDDSRRTTKEIKFVRPMPVSSLEEYRHSIGKIDWPLMMDGLSSSEMVVTFQKMSTDLVDIHFPLKKISISQFDKPYMTEELRSIRRRRQRLYRREGRSEEYLEVRKEFYKKLNIEAGKYTEKITEEVSSGKRCSSYAAIRKLGNKAFEQPGETNSFEIPEFEGLNDEQSAEVLADYFSSISQLFEPISIDKFAPNIKDELSRGSKTKNTPILQEHAVHSKIVKAKKPRSTVPAEVK